MDPDQLFVILISLIVAATLCFIVMAMRAFWRPHNRGSSVNKPSGTHDSGPRLGATDYSSSSDPSETTLDSGGAFGGGGDFSGGGSGGSWGDAIDSGGDSGGGGE